MLFATHLVISNTLEGLELVESTKTSETGLFTVNFSQFSMFCNKHFIYQNILQSASLVMLETSKIYRKSIKINKISQITVF